MPTATRHSPTSRPPPATTTSRCPSRAGTSSASPRRELAGPPDHRAGTVELNTTFYRLPTTAAVDRWAEQAPPGFVYALKLGQFGSHRMKLRDASSWLPNHLDRARRLGSALGPTLVQLPPKWKRNVARLDEFFDAAPPDLRWAVELRESSWLHDDVFDVLRRHRAALCIHDLIQPHPFVCTTDWTYVRFHGPDAIANPYRGAYGARRLRPWADRLAGELDSGHDVYCSFNNDFDGCAVRDAIWLRTALGVPSVCASPDRGTGLS